jgi:predicted nucleotidyltransferase
MNGSDTVDPRTFGLTEQDTWLLRDLLRRHLTGLGALHVYLHGSRAKGKFHPFSDVDLALEGEGSIDGARLEALRAACDDSALPYIVDVADMAHATPIFRANVERSRKLFLEFPEAFIFVGGQN